MFTRHKGEVLLVIGAIAFAFNGIVAKIVLQAGLSEWRLVQVRTGGAFLFLVTFVLLTNAKSLKITKKELPLLITYSVFGFALVQFGYFIAISRMNISMALIIEFTAPIWIVLWIKYVRKAFVPKDMWLAISLAFIGMLLSTTVSQAQLFSDDFEAYNTGALGPQSSSWTTWSGTEGGPEDGIVSTTQASSGTKSIYFNSTLIKIKNPQNHSSRSIRLYFFFASFLEQALKCHHSVGIFLNPCDCMTFRNNLLFSICCSVNSPVCKKCASFSG